MKIRTAVTGGVATCVPAMSSEVPGGIATCVPANSQVRSSRSHLLLIDICFYQKSAPLFFSPLLPSSPPGLTLTGFILTKSHILDRLADSWMLAVAIRGCLLFLSITKKVHLC